MTKTSKLKIIALVSSVLALSMPLIAFSCKNNNKQEIELDIINNKATTLDKKVDTFSDKTSLKELQESLNELSELQIKIDKILKQLLKDKFEQKVIEKALNIQKYLVKIKSKLTEKEKNIKSPKPQQPGKKPDTPSPKPKEPKKEEPKKDDLNLDRLTEEELNKDRSSPWTPKEGEKQQPRDKEKWPEVHALKATTIELYKNNQNLIDDLANSKDKAAIQKLFEEITKLAIKAEILSKELESKDYGTIIFYEANDLFVALKCFQQNLQDHLENLSNGS